MLAHAVWHVCEQDPKVQARSMLALVWLKSIYDITKHLGDTESVGMSRMKRYSFVFVTGMSSSVVLTA